MHLVSVHLSGSRRRCGQQARRGPRRPGESFRDVALASERGPTVADEDAQMTTNPLTRPVRITSGSQPRGELDCGHVAEPVGTTPATPGRVLGVRKAARRSLTRIFWSFASFVAVCICGVGTGLRGLDGSAAPWARSGILLCGLALLVMLTRTVNSDLAKDVERWETLTEPPLRKKVVGPFRRWAIWMSTACTACAAAYLLNEHPSGKPSLVPARVSDVIAIAAGAALVAPYIVDLSVVPGRGVGRGPGLGSWTANCERAMM